MRRCFTIVCKEKTELVYGDSNLCASSFHAKHVFRRTLSSAASLAQGSSVE